MVNDCKISLGGCIDLVDEDSLGAVEELGVLDSNNISPDFLPSLRQLCKVQ